ncbi:Apoptosis-inducing factor-like protein B [Lachnellula occidentalis]|uniref:Apoptosis-inducing factor-like protein B n=1 Tax=Lachnellula occidentalis TaxID=215460 RepID=A0A8H8RRF2_9HELO|nr:Apoptosis-inducing factor-like protein B [Lachnellula occidentalis]
MFDADGFYRPHILVVGGAYGGLSVVTNVLNLMAGNAQLTSQLPPPPLGCSIQTPPRVTILDERDGIYHTMGSPLVCASESFASEAWRKFDEIPLINRHNVRSIQGRASAIDMSSRIATYQENSSGPVKQISYDYLVVATGTQRSWPVVPRALNRSGFLRDIQDHTSSIRDAKRAVVVGGGVYLALR